MVKEKKEVQKISKRVQICTQVYVLLSKGISPSHINKDNKEENSICSILKIKKNNLSYYLSLLKELKLVSNPHQSIWKIEKELTEQEVQNILQKEVQNRGSKKSSLGLNIYKPTTNLHALQIHFPILEGKIEDSDWTIKNRLKNWLPKYKGLNQLGGLEIRNNNNKSLTVWAKSRDIKTLEEIDNLAFKIRAYIYEYFKTKHNVILDVFNVETKNLDIATEDKQGEESGMLRKGEKFTLNLNKKAEKIFPKDKIDGKAYLDGSPFKFTVETNDKEWKREYLSMPFNIKDLKSAVMYIAQNYASHVGVVEKLDKILEIPEVKKHIRKQVKNSRQTKIGDFF